MTRERMGAEDLLCDAVYCVVCAPRRRETDFAIAQCRGDDGVRRCTRGVGVDGAFCIVHSHWSCFDPVPYPLCKELLKVNVLGIPNYLRPHPGTTWEAEYAKILGMCKALRVWVSRTGNPMALVDCGPHVGQKVAVCAFFKGAAAIDDENRYALFDVGDLRAVESAPLEVRYNGGDTEYGNPYGRVTRSESQIAIYTVLMETPPGLSVDHITRDPMDNTRANLRIADGTMQGKNRRVKIFHRTRCGGLLGCTGGRMLTDMDAFMILLKKACIARAREMLRYRATPIWLSTRERSYVSVGPPS